MPLKPAKHSLKLLFLFSISVLLLGLGFWGWWNWASASIQPPTGDSTLDQNGQQSAVAKTVQIQIPQGTSAKQIGQILQQAGLIRSTTAWNLWTRLLMVQDPENGLQAGVYRLSPTQSLQEIAQTIRTGDVVQTSFTIPEGKSLRQMATYFEAQGFFRAEDFLKAADQIPYERYPWLPPNLPHLEGFLYPDTYQFPPDQITPEAVVQIMLDRFQQVALPLYQSQSQLSLLEWVTLASIVEKEAVIPVERPRIAGVFLNRLQRKIPLGADPTVEYSLGIQQTPDQPLTLAQVNTPSAYNTYLKLGLPPTPIASPGLASLKAALTPEKTDLLYFVARYDGTHIFSRTLSEHEAAQAQIRSQRATQSPPKKVN